MTEAETAPGTENARSGFRTNSVRPWFWMVWAVLALCSGGPANAQGFPALLSRSYSGQFIIQSAPGPSAYPLAGMLENDTNLVRLDATLLTVSCERIKQILTRELGTSGTWKGKIFLRLYPARSADDPITIDAEQFRDGWQYRVTLPALIVRERYVGAVVQVLLLELANRTADGHSAEMPTWLTEGLGRQLLEANQSEIILTPPKASDTGLRVQLLQVSAQRQNPLDRAHADLCAGTPLTFQQLSWPVADPVTGDVSELYRSSAQLFVHQLLELENGRASMRSMLEDLPRYYNWQFAFLHAFQATFGQLVDVEKWWSLQLVHFTGRGLGETWAAADSWRKLDELVRSAVQIRVGTNELPLHGEVALQTIIRDWDPGRQNTALEMKLRELQMLRPRLSPELGQLDSDYCKVIETYLQNQNHGGFVLPFRKLATRHRHAAEASQSLDELDAKREALRPPEQTADQIQASSKPAQ